MDFQEGFPSREAQFEYTPSPEQIHAVFRELAPQGYTEQRKLGDDRGLYLLEVITPGNLENEYVEYAYMRQGHYREGGIITHEIHVTYYDNDRPVSGTSAAKFDMGEWSIIE